MGKLKPFKAVLIPDQKAAEVALWERPSASHPNGRRIALPFTRSGAGRTVRIGNRFVDVPANVPAWKSDSDGCRIEMLPAQTNTALNFDAPPAHALYESYAWDSIDNLNGSLYFPNNSVDRTYVWGSGVISTPHVLSFIIRMDDLSEPFSQMESPSPDFEIGIDGFSAVPMGVTKIQLENNEWLYVCTRTTKSTGGQLAENGIRKRTINSQKAFRISAFQYSLGNYIDALIPTNGSAVTRPQDAVTAFAPINLGMLTATEGTLLIKGMFFNRVNEPNAFFQLGNQGSSRFLITRSFSTQEFPWLIVDNASAQTVGVKQLTQELNAFALRWAESGWGLYLNGGLVDSGADALNFADALRFTGANRYELMTVAFSPTDIGHAACIDASTL